MEAGSATSSDLLGHSGTHSIGFGVVIASTTLIAAIVPTGKCRYVQSRFCAPHAYPTVSTPSEERHYEATTISGTAMEFRCSSGVRAEF